MLFHGDQFEGDRQFAQDKVVIQTDTGSYELVLKAAVPRWGGGWQGTNGHGRAGLAHSSSAVPAGNSRLPVCPTPKEVILAFGFA